jgi:OOP family OmpA-OmpF porin
VIDMSRRYFSRLVLAGLFVLGGLVPHDVLAQPSWYLGASIGQSAIDAGSGEVERGFLLDDAFVATGTTLDKSDTGGKAYFGRRFNRFLAAEAGYVDLGEASFNTTIVGAPPGTAPAPPFSIHATATAKGVFLAGLAHLPLTDSFSFFGKAGLLRSEAKFTERIAETGATRVSRSERNTEALYGLGLQMQFTALVGGRIEWERFKNVGRGIGGREGRDVDYLSAGVFLQF